MSKSVVQDKIAVVTGGASGIGYAIANQLLSNGAKVTILLDPNETLGKEAVRKLTSKHGSNKVSFYKCDVTEDLHKTIDKIIDKYKSVDILVNNAGTTIPLSSKNEKGNKRVIEVNVTAVILWSFKFWDFMRKDQGGDGGIILNVSSIYGHQTNPFNPVYQASKFAVNGFTKSLGHEVNFKKTGVKVVAICPGYTNTSLMDKVTNSTGDMTLRDEANKMMEKKMWQQPEAVGAAAIEIIETTDSGTLWIIEGGNPIEEVKN